MTTRRDMPLWSLLVLRVRLKVLVWRHRATRALSGRVVRKWLLMRVLIVACWAAERLVEPDVQRRLQEQEPAG